jgi:RNA polymerase sigma-70 factor (ECF subfamily)
MGNRDAFAVLVDRYHARLLRHLTWKTGDADLAADLTQEAFVEAFVHFHRLADDRAFVAWLYGIAHNRLRMAARRRRLQQVVSLDWLPLPLFATMPSLRRQDSSASCVEQALLVEVLDGLSQPLREALLLHSLDGFGAPEVARILGISLPAAERRISRARERFRERYWALSSEEWAGDAPSWSPSRVR